MKNHWLDQIKRKKKLEEIFFFQYHLHMGRMNNAKLNRNQNGEYHEKSLVRPDQAKEKA